MRFDNLKDSKDLKVPKDLTPLQPYSKQVNEVQVDKIVPEIND